MKGQRFMSRARQRGWEAAAGEPQERRIWRRLGIDGGSAAGAPAAKRVLHRWMEAGAPHPADATGGRARVSPRTQPAPRLPCPPC